VIELLCACLQAIAQVGEGQAGNGGLCHLGRHSPSTTGHKRKTRPKPGFGLCHRAWRRSRTGRCAPAQLLNWLPVL